MNEFRKIFKELLDKAVQQLHPDEYEHFDIFWDVFSKELNLGKFEKTKCIDDLSLIQNPGLLSTQFHSPLVMLSLTINCVMYRILNMKLSDIDNKKLVGILDECITDNNIPKDMIEKYQKIILSILQDLDLTSSLEKKNIDNKPNTVVYKGEKKPFSQKKIDSFKSDKKFPLVVYESKTNEVYIFGKKTKAFEGKNIPFFLLSFLACQPPDTIVSYKLMLEYVWKEELDKLNQRDKNDKINHAKRHIKKIENKILEPFFLTVDGIGIRTSKNYRALYVFNINTTFN